MRLALVFITPDILPFNRRGVFNGSVVKHDGRYVMILRGVALTDLTDPAKLIRVGDECIMTPEMPYEQSGHTPNCVFASSHAAEDDGSVKILYGASDRYQCVAETSIDELLDVALNR